MASQDTLEEDEPETDVVCGSIMSGSLNDFELLDDVSEAEDDAASLAQSEDSSVHTENVFELLEEIDNILTGFDHDHKVLQKQPPAKLTKTRNRLARFMGAGRAAVMAATTSNRKRTKSLESPIPSSISRIPSFSRSLTGQASTPESVSGSTTASRASGKQAPDAASVPGSTPSRASAGRASVAASVSGSTFSSRASAGKASEAVSVSLT